MNATEPVSCKVLLIVFVSRDIIRLLGSFALLWGIIKFHYFVNKNGNKNLVMSTVKKCLCYNKETCVMWTSIFGIIFIITMSITIIPFTIVFRTDDINLQSWYHVLEFPVFFVDILKILFMLAVTLIVKSKWSTRYEPQGETIKEKFESLIKHYTHTGNIVCKLQNIFKYWFILNWMTFFINMAFNALTALKSLMGDEQTDSQTVGLWIYALLLLFDSFAFSLPYICGNAMIDYHMKYLSALKEKQRVIFSDPAVIPQNMPYFWTIQCANIIPQRREYQFIPSIMWVDVPLDSPGYVLSILLALFSLLIHFIL